MMWSIRTLNVLVHTITIAAKYLNIPQSGRWHGTDGPWSSFSLEIGSPLQSLDFLPSSSGVNIIPFDASTCDSGTQSVTCRSSSGGVFTRNASSTWNADGLKAVPIGLGAWWNFTGYCQYGMDVLSIKQSNGSSLRLLDETLVASMTNTSGYTTNAIGLLDNVLEYKNGPRFESLLHNLVKAEVVDSKAWPYTAGSTALKQHGSLVLGGYDESRFNPAKTLTVTGKNLTAAQNLTFALQGVSDENVTQGVFLQYPIDVVVSTDIPEIWLPTSVCQQFEAVYGIRRDNKSGLYLVDDDLHTALIQKNVTISFHIATNRTSTSSVTVDVPYALMALNITVDGAERRYFPIRQAPEVKYYMLGRAFLQAAYLRINYDNHTFQLNPALYPGNDADPVLRSTSEEASTASRIDVVTAVGIVIGVSVIIVLLIGVVAIWKRRTRTKKSIPPSELLHETYKPELAASPIYAPPAYRSRTASNATVGTTRSEVDAIDTMRSNRLETLQEVQEVHEVPEKRTPVEPIELDAGFLGAEKALVESTPVEAPAMQISFDPQLEVTTEEELVSPIIERSTDDGGSRVYQDFWDRSVSDQDRSRHNSL